MLDNAMDPLLAREEIGRKDIIRLERESVIPILKHKLIHALAKHVDDRSERDEFLKFCQRVEYTVRAWYNLHFGDLMHLYSLFEPFHGAQRLEQQNLTPEEINDLEEKFVDYVFEVMDKSNFKMTTDEEINIANATQYRLHLEILLDETKLDTGLLTRYFAKHPHDNLPSFTDKYVIFRRGFGIDQMTACFFSEKVNTIVARIWKFLLTITGIRRLINMQRCHQPTEKIEVKIDSHDKSLYIERIRIENMKLSFTNLLKKITIQEPTFEHIIVLYRKAPTETESERSIHVRHFKNIPMADMEIVLPEKKNPGLTPLDWLKFLVSAAIGLITVISALRKGKAEFWVIATILGTVVGYGLKTYFTFQRNMADYQSLITQTVYEKQLDSGRGTLLHLCDEVIQQEVKEVIISFFMLMKQERAVSKEDLDRQSEDFIKEEFRECCDFDVDDAVNKLEKLRLVSRDPHGLYTCVSLEKANEMIGTTTEEVVLMARQGRYNGFGGNQNSEYACSDVIEEK